MDSSFGNLMCRMLQECNAESLACHKFWAFLPRARRPCDVFLDITHGPDLHAMIGWGCGQCHIVVATGNWANLWNRDCVTVMNNKNNNNHVIWSRHRRLRNLSQLLKSLHRQKCVCVCVSVYVCVCVLPFKLNLEWYIFIFLAIWSLKGC